MDDYDVAPSPTTEGASYNAWIMARIGNGIDALVDRAIIRQPIMAAGGQQYGVDENGRMYVLGQTNSQVVAQVQKSQAISPVLLIGIVALVVVLGAK